MSHKNVAAVWKDLQRRPDIDHILLELIGRYSLDVALCRTDYHRLRSISYQHAVALKVVFDLQRTYLQSSRPSFESKSALLHHDLLFSAIIHLLDLKAETFRGTSKTPDYYPYCSFLAQVLLSGLRALLLRRRSLSAKEYDTLTNRFDQVWRDERLENADLFVVQSLCRRIIQELFKGAQDSKYALPACGTVDLPDFFHKLYPVEIQEKSLVIAARNARCLSSSSPDWFQNALVLYDIYWSTIAALIQLFTDCQKRKELYTWTNTDEFGRQNDLNAILGTRFNLLNQIYSYDNPRCQSEDDEWMNEQMKTVLLLGIQPSCSQDQCLCFGDDQLDINNLRITLGAQELPNRLNKYLLATQPLDGSENALKILQSTLSTRTAALLDCNGELEDLSQKLQGYLQDWCPRVHPTGYDSKYISVQDDFYVIACPELHALPAKDIFGGFVETIVEDERQEANNPLVVGIKSNFRCPQCTWDARVISARKIEPLSRISSQIQGRLQSWQQIMQKRIDLQQVVPDCLKSGLELNPRSVTSSNYSSPSLSAAAVTSPISPMIPKSNTEDFPELVTDLVPQISPRPESIYSRYSVSSSTRMAPITVSRKPYTWQSLFKPGRGSSSPISVPSYAFFSCGKKLLLWNERGFGFYDLRDADSIGFQRISSHNTRMAAGGTNYCAIISKNGTDYMLLIFQDSHGDPVFEQKVEGSPYAVAVSRNDRYVALKFSRYIQIFDIVSKECFHHDLPYKNSRSGPSNNLVAFSSDSASVIASTRYEPEKVITYWSECTKPCKTNNIESSAPFGLVGDDGLSSIVYSNNSSHWAFLATFTEKGFPVFLGLSESRPVSQQLRDNNKQIGARIHRATLCAAGTNLAIINQRNDIYWVLDAFNIEKGARRVTNIKRPVSVKRDVELGMPSSDEVHVFWIDKGQGKLVTVGRLGGKSKPVELNIDMSQLAS